MSTRSMRNKILFKSALITSCGLVAYKYYQKLTNPNESSQAKMLEIDNKLSDKDKHWSWEVNDDEKEQSSTDLKVLIHSTDTFNGIRINCDRLPISKYEFKSKLLYSLKKWKNNKKRGIFLKLLIPKYSQHLDIAIKDGEFEIHHARPDYIMLIKWLPSNEPNMIPDYCHTYIATGCLIINKYKQAVIIQEKWKKKGRKEHWKLPGGAVDRLENIYDAAMREAKEETGLDTIFKGVLQFRHFHPFRFGNSGDIYFICLLKYDGKITENGEEFELDPNEIAECKWMDIDHVLDLKEQQATFGSEEGKKSIKRNVDLLIKNWDKDDNNNDGLTTLFPYNSRENREFYVYQPLVPNNTHGGTTLMGFCDKNEDLNK